jgi:MoaA/NifB/PqqE/SkfB family radical SAM enzyme
MSAGCRHGGVGTDKMLDLLFSRPSLLLRGMTTFAANLLFARLLNRASPRGPLFVTILPTYDCNAYCGFCSTHKLKKRFGDDLTVARAEALADEIGRSGTIMAGFSGGEALMSPILYPMLEGLRRHGIVTYVVTNGLLLEDQAEKLIASGVDMVVVSLDSEKPDIHDGGRGVPGLYDRALAGIEALHRLRKGKHPRIKINTVVSKANIAELGATLDRFQQLADVVTVQPISYGYENAPHGKLKDGLARYAFAEPGERERVEPLLEQQLLSRKAFRNGYVRRFASYWFEADVLAEKIACWAPFLRLLVQPNGEALHCVANARFGAIGDVNKQSLMDVWNGEAIRAHRETIRRGENHCTCWTMDTSFNSMFHDIAPLRWLAALGRRRPDK